MHLPSTVTLLTLLANIVTTTSALPPFQRILDSLLPQDPDFGLLKDKYTGHKRPTSAQVVKVLEKAEIIPTVLNLFHPSFLVNVTWGPHASAALGNTIAVSLLQDKPVVVLEEPRGGKSEEYALRKRGTAAPLNNLVVTLTDPDAPSRKNPKWSEMAHWIAIGLPLNLSDASTAGGLHPFKDVIDYKPPGPPPGTGKHRYVLTAWAPANGTSVPLELVPPKERQHWGRDEYAGVREWAVDMGLAPIAANFIYAKHSKE